MKVLEERKVENITLSESNKKNIHIYRGDKEITKYRNKEIQ